MSNNTDYILQVKDLKKYFTIFLWKEAVLYERRVL